MHSAASSGSPQVKALGKNSADPLKVLHALLSKTSINGCTPIARNTFGVESDARLAVDFLSLDTHTTREDIREINRLLQAQLGIKDKYTLKYADVSKNGYPILSCL